MLIPKTCSTLKQIPAAHPPPKAQPDRNFSTNLRKSTTIADRGLLSRNGKISVYIQGNVIPHRYTIAPGWQSL
jgi:hypothetical protein